MTEEPTENYRMVVLNENDVSYGVLPYFHLGGLMTVFCQLAQGTKIIINKRFDAEIFLKDISKYQVNP